METGNQKKKLGIVLGATGNMAFAAANVLMGLNEHLSETEYDVIVYHKGISAKDMEIMNKIRQVQFIEYNYFEEHKDKFDLNTINRFTTLAFSRYECFRLLEKYQKVIWLDIDLLIKANINELLNYCKTGIGLYSAGSILSQELHVKLENFNINNKSYNSGVIVLQDNLKDYNIIADWCYQKTLEFAEHLNCPDQTIINLALQQFNLNVDELPVEFNCHPDYPENRIALILHPFCMEKYWNYYSDRTWNKNYKKWKIMGGSRFTGHKYNFIEKLIIKYKKIYFLEAPDPIRQTRKFFMYVIKQKRNKEKNAG